MMQMDGEWEVVASTETSKSVSKNTIKSTSVFLTPQKTKVENVKETG